MTLGLHLVIAIAALGIFACGVLAGMLILRELQLWQRAHARGGTLDLTPEPNDDWFSD